VVKAAPSAPPGTPFVQELAKSITGPQNIPRPKKARIVMKALPECDRSAGHMSPYPTLRVKVPRGEHLKVIRGKQWNR